MASELVGQHPISEAVYRKCWWRPTGAEKSEPWYDRHRVLKVTAKQVHVCDYSGRVLVLDRIRLQKWGHVFHRGVGALFLTEMPEEYRQQTIGYLMDRQPYEVLGVSGRLTPDKLKAAYRRRAKETHPDHGGDPAEFRAVQVAYDRLSRGHSLGEILEFIQADS